MPMTASEEKMAEVRAKYGRTIHEILAKEGQHDLYKLLGAIEILVGSKLLKKIPTSNSERMLFAFVWMQREVQNGGFDQFFFNSAGDFWKDVLWGLEAISDKDGLADYKKVLSIFPDSTPSLDRSERYDQLNKPEEEIDVELLKDCFAKAKKIDGLTIVELPECKQIDEANDLDEWDAKVSAHWQAVSQEYYKKPFPNWKLVFEYVMSHAADFDLAKA